MPKRSASSSSLERREAKKPRRMTETQLDRKRELDRAAQRNSRARTRNHIDYLESLVKSLRADADDRVTDLLQQLDKKQAEIQRLRGVLNNIGKQLALAEKDTLPEETPTPTHKVVESEKNDCLPLSPMSPEPLPVADLPPVDELSQTFTVDEPGDQMDEMDGIDEIPVPPVDDPDSSTTSAEGSPQPQCQSITQLASSITSKTNLEGRLWYLAGAILNQILSIPTSAPITTAFDEEIAIRAVFHGWTSVVERYSLDRGWQWLKELDERVYFHQSAPVRLLNLRNCRLMFLKQLFPDDGWGALVPPCYTPRPLQEHVSHDPLIEHFPWPGFREKLLLSPLKFATNKFMDAMRTHVDFMWNQDPKDMYVKDPLTGLYRYSDLTTARLHDFRCYIMRPEFFVHFPELRADIPCSAVLPQSLFPAGMVRSPDKYQKAAAADSMNPSANARRETNNEYIHLVQEIDSSLSAAISQVLEVLA